MTRQSRFRFCLMAAAAAAVLAAPAWAACTATFTAGDSGTFGGTFKYDRKAKVLTVDLSGLPKAATVFRAELMLNGRQQFQQPTTSPTTVYPVGRPDAKLKFVAPRFVSLDALQAVRAARQAGGPLKLKLETTLSGAHRLEVSYLQGRPKAGGLPRVTGLKVTHRRGQTLVVFAEPRLEVSAPVAPPFKGTLAEVVVKDGQKVKAGDVLARLDTAELAKRLAKAEAGKVKYRIDAARQRLAAATLRALIDGVVVMPAGPPKAGAKVRPDRKLFAVRGPLAPGAYPPLANGAKAGALRSAAARSHPGLRFRIWRSGERITPKTIATARLVGECGLMTAWNSGHWQNDTGKRPPLRFRVTDNGREVPWGTGIYAHNPASAGKAHYAVTVSLDGQEDFATLGAGNTTAEPVDETVGQGQPVLQWMEKYEGKKGFIYRRGPLTLLVYTRWEAWPHSATPSKPIDYIVAMGDDPKPAKPPREWHNHAWRVEPAPVGLHLHCWGASLRGGYGWWHNAHRGAVLIASNQVPYDWWTGYHEANGTSKTFGDGHVRPFTMDRTFGFLDWATTQWKDAPAACRKHWRKLDLTRVFTAGSSMGGAGAPMYAIRYGDRIGWCMAWVGVHVPGESPQFTGSYRGNYGRPDPAITMPDGKTTPWDHFSDVWWLRQHPQAETGFIMASNGKSDGDIGWPQAVKFARALQDTRRPHLYNWGPGGHDTRTVIGANFNLDVRTDQSLPAFTNGTLDNNIGTAKRRSKDQIARLKAERIAKAKAAGKDMKKFRPTVTGFDGDESGAYNLHLWWQTDDVVDTAASWEMTVILKNSAPQDRCRVDLTPRRLQKFATPKGRKFQYTVTDLQSGNVLIESKATADKLGLLTLEQIPLVKGKNRVKIAPKN